MALVEPKTEQLLEETHPSVAHQAAEMFQDLSTEMKQEVEDYQGGGRLVENPQSDLTVRKHVLGIVILLFSLVAVVLLLGIGGIWLSGHGGAFKR